MKRYIVILLILVISLISGEASFGFTSAKDVPIGNSLNPKIIDTFPLPERFSYSGSMFIQSEKYLWVVVRELYKTKDNKSDWKTLFAVFDISNRTKPKLLIIHEAPGMQDLIGFKGNYGYLLYKNRNSVKKPQDGKDSGFIIYDVTDPIYPKFVNKTKPMFDFPWQCFIYGDYMYTSHHVFGKPYGAGDHTIILKVSLEDPANPKLVASLKGMDGKSEEFDGSVAKIIARDNFLYVNTINRIYIFDIEKEKMTAAFEGGVSSFDDTCLADEYMSKDDTYIMASGQTPQLFYPGEREGISPYARTSSHQNGIAVLAQGQNEYSFTENWIGHAASVRIPIDSQYIASKGALTYVVGFIPVEDDSYPPRQPFPPSRLLVVDFSYLDDPKFAGSLDFDGAITNWIPEGNVAYLLNLKEQGQKTEARRIEMITVELPVKEARFHEHPVTMSDMYPGYKELEITPKSIEVVLREQINKPSGDLTINDFKDLKILDASKRKITDLTGIELCTNLEELDLGINYITDLSLLSKLNNLKTLNLRSNKITNIDALSGLTNLEEINLSRNRITNIAPLLSLPKLTKLDLSRNSEADFAPISELARLTELKLEYNNIFRPPDLSGLKQLKSLNLALNDIFYTDFIKNLNPEIEELYLHSNIIRNISSLSSLVNLRKIRLDHNDLRSLDSLSDFTNLVELNVSENQKLKDIKALSNLTDLSILNLADLRIQDISPIENLTNLEDLNISHGNNSKILIDDLKPLAKLQNLQKLNAEGNNIKDLEPLTGLSKLAELNLMQNRIEKIEPLKNLKGLETLRIRSNKIQDIRPLTELLTKLAILDISANPIKDMKSWIGLGENHVNPNLILYLHETSIPQEQIDQIRKTVTIPPSRNENIVVGNLIVTAEAQNKYFNANGKYAPSLDELIKSGTMHDPGANPEDKFFKHYQIARFDVTENSFTIIIFPKGEKGNENSRIFAVTKDELIREWLGSIKEFEPSIPLDNGDKWKIWTERIKAGIYGCGPGG